MTQNQCLKGKKKNVHLCQWHTLTTRHNFDVVHATGLVCNISPIERVETNEKAICLRKATLKDTRDDIPFIVFGGLTDKLKEPDTLILRDFRVSKYMTTRLLKSTEMSTIQKAEGEVLVDTNDLKDSNHAEVTGKIFSLELDSLSEKIVCLKCKGNVEQLNEKIVVCNSCNLRREVQKVRQCNIYSFS